ncbi:MAG: dihydroorotate dehydrogenase electron transfer subunit [Actinobacteria bacterium]|nr:dihydroorotate dehydrogenase electron transfer subunit [Actinomycetota bacterium]
MNAIYRLQAEVLNKEELIPGVFRIKLFSEEISRAAKPGQFVHVACGKGRDFILRRPFSIHRRLSGNAFEILFQVVGRGTEALSEVRLHDFVDVLGPLGNSFEIPPDLSSALLVAGGVGIAPLIFLADELNSRKVRFYAIQGATTQQRLFCYMDLKRLGRQIFATTEDGTAGHCGRATDLIHEVIKKSAPERIYSCGPEGMLKVVADVAAAFGIDCQVSVERRMACGLGACLSCVCQTRDGYRLACKDGPVFRAEELSWKA